MVCSIFTPQPFGLKQYCCITGRQADRQAGGWFQTLRNTYLLKPLDGFFPFKVLRNCLDLKLCNVMVICTFAPYELAHGAKVWYHFGSISMNLLDQFTPFEALWHCLDLQLCNFKVICPFVPDGLAHGPKTCQIWYHWNPNFVEPISLKALDRFTPFYNMVCSVLFLQRALYTVHCTNIMHSRKPSFVITPAVFS